MASASAFPMPHVVPPMTAHTHTFIFLHGRGSNGAEFAEEILEGQSSAGMTLRHHLPSWKWVFPTSQTRFSTVFEEEMSEWFDIHSLTTPNQAEESQVDGLRQSVGYIQGLVDAEARLVTREHLVLGGISQGCATSLYVLMSQPCAIGAYVGLCGWLPFAAQLDEIAASTQEMPAELPSRLYNFQRIILGPDPALASAPSENGFLKTPVFLGHADDDDVVDIDLARILCNVLWSMGFAVVWKEYGNCGHWIKEPDGLDHVLSFLKESCALDVE